MSAGAWLDERLGTRRLAAALLYRRVPRAVGWLHTLGSASLFVLVVQLLTGIFLAFYYVPSVEHAWGSVDYITHRLPFGAFVRGLHHWGASLAVVLVVLHLLRVFFMGAYKYPREATWVSGVLLLAVVFAFGFTGDLLPWDQKGYWATVVGTYIAGWALGIGEVASRLLRGGPEVGVQTLGRFYAFHVLFLPAFLLAVDLELGKRIYGQKCASCHGPSGKGNPRVAQALKTTIPDLTTSSLGAAEALRITVEGKGRMPGYAKSLGEDELQAVTAYSRSLAKGGR